MNPISNRPPVNKTVLILEYMKKVPTLAAAGYWNGKNWIGTVTECILPLEDCPNSEFYWIEFPKYPQE